MALFKPDTTSTRAGSTNSPEIKKSPTGPGEDGGVGPKDAPKVNQDAKHLSKDSDGNKPPKA